MAPLNPFITENKDKLDHFLDALSAKDGHGDKNQTHHDDDENKTNDSGTTIPGTTVSVHNKKNHEEKLVEQMTKLVRTLNHHYDALLERVPAGELFGAADEEMKIATLTSLHLLGVRLGKVDPS